MCVPKLIYIYIHMIDIAFYHMFFYALDLCFYAHYPYTHFHLQELFDQMQLAEGDNFDDLPTVCMDAIPTTTTTRTTSTTLPTGATAQTTTKTTTSYSDSASAKDNDMQDVDSRSNSIVENGAEARAGPEEESESAQTESEIEIFKQMRDWQHAQAMGFSLFESASDQDQDQSKEETAKRNKVDQANVGGGAGSRIRPPAALTQSGLVKDEAQERKEQLEAVAQVMQD